MSDEWLPNLICLEDAGGDWNAYLELLYQAFVADFVRSKPRWPGKRVAMKRHPEYQGKGATFWHMISEGGIEDERIPDLRRCERIGWPRPIMEAFPDQKPAQGDRIVWWRNQRGREQRIVLALVDFSYVVIVSEREDFVLPWTAYTVEQTHRRHKLQREFEDYWRGATMKNKAPKFAERERETQRSEPPKMLKPPWWTASLLLQRMVDELPESRTLSESVKVGIRTENRSVIAITCRSGPDSHLGASRQISFVRSKGTQNQKLAHLEANRRTGKSP